MIMHMGKECGTMNLGCLLSCFHVTIQMSNPNTLASHLFEKGQGDIAKLCCCQCTYWMDRQKEQYSSLHQLA
jgi:hypothetical protein